MKQVTPAKRLSQINLNKMVNISKAVFLEINVSKQR